MKRLAVPALVPLLLALAACSPSDPGKGPAAPASALPPVAVRTATAVPSDIDEVLSPQPESRAAARAKVFSSFFIISILNA